MSEPNLVPSSWLTEQEISGQENSLDTVEIDAPEEGSLKPRLNLLRREDESGYTQDMPHEIEPLPSEEFLDLEHHRQRWEQEHSALLTELVQLRSLTHEQVERIHNLEQALDQSLKSLDELRVQVVDQQFLETQLASTEEISNVQQQAITRLKLQLAQQQQALDAQLAEIQTRDRTFQELLVTMEVLTQAQKTELEHLRTQLARDQIDVQAYQNRLETQLSSVQTTFKLQQQRLLELESQSLSARVLNTTLEVWLAQAQAQVQELLQQYGEQPDEQTKLGQLETMLQQAHAALQTQSRAIEPPLLQSTTSHPAPDLNQMQQELETAQTKIEELETEIAKQVTTQAMLQHACQELEVERDRQQARITELESQAADMQEQILKQAKQASEYEAAVQHWKDRYWSYCDQVQHLKDLIDQALPNPSAELVEAFAVLLATSAPAAIQPEAQAPPQSTPASSIDIPDFLMRRRNYKSRRS